MAPMLAVPPKEPPLCKWDIPNRQQKLGSKQRHCKVVVLINVSWSSFCFAILCPTRIQVPFHNHHKSNCRSYNRLIFHPLYADLRNRCVFSWLALAHDRVVEVQSREFDPKSLSGMTEDQNREGYISTLGSCSE